MQKSKMTRLRNQAKAWLTGMWPYVAASLNGSRRKRIRQIIRETKIEDENGIDEFYSINLNNAQQWVRIRGRDTNNPVLLYLHGGPGSSSLPIYSEGLHDWEHHFTVVQWDQRGSGKSYQAGIDPESMNLDQLVDDTLALIKYVLNKLSKEKICLLGHSWGSFLGIHTLLRSSDLVGAYVGTGQVVDMIQAERIAYDYARKKATEKNDSVARDELEALAPYPTGLHQDHAKRPIARKWARYYGWNGATEVARTRTALMTTPEYTLIDIYRYLRGSIFSSPLTSQLIDQSLQPAFLSRTFSVPIFFLSGATDAYTPTELVEEYFQSILADEKKHVIFKNSGHWPMLSEFDRYLHVLVQDVRPHLI